MPAQADQLAPPAWPPAASGGAPPSSASWSSVSHGECRALLTVRLSALSFCRGEMSKIVRAGVVTRMPSCVVTSRRRRVVDRWTRIPFGRRSPTSVHLERLLPVAPVAPEHHRRAVAERRARSARQDGGAGALVGREGGPADGVHAPEHAVQPADPEPVADRVVVSPRSSNCRRVMLPFCLARHRDRDRRDPIAAWEETHRGIGRFFPTPGCWRSGSGRSGAGSWTGSGGVSGVTYNKSPQPRDSPPRPGMTVLFRHRRRHHAPPRGSRSTRDGAVLARAEAAYPLSTPRPGWSEQDPEDWWRATESVLDAPRPTPPARPPASAFRPDARPRGARRAATASCAPRSSGTTSARRPSATRSRRTIGLERLIALTGNRALRRLHRAEAPVAAPPRAGRLRAHRPDRCCPRTTCASG